MIGPCPNMQSEHCLDIYLEITLESARWICQRGLTTACLGRTVHAFKNELDYSYLDMSHIG